ncbi:ASTRA complex subunit [Trifolium repens]|nr:ASTRA complex subunit [Trifolium repens]
MEQVEQENTELHGQVSTLQAEVERLSALVSSMVVAQNQPPTPPPQATVISEIVSTPISAAFASIPQHIMPRGYPWGMPLDLNGGFRPYVSEVSVPATQQVIFATQTGTFPQATVPVSMTFSAPVIHTTPQDNRPIHHAESVGAYDRMDDFQERFDEMQREINALRGKDLFGKNAHDLCLVPNVQIPAKFKVPEFEKYKGNTCPQSHLVMYARKMSTQTDNHQLLIHYFQDSLTDAALKWYMSLDSAKIRTFNDLGEAFIRQYKYNLDMAPDRDQLRAMSQKDNETFKEYAQRWREVAAQIIPPLEEKEMTKIFLNTLGPFYYERMIASAPSDFTEMVNMGMRLEEGVRQGRLVRESIPTNSVKKFGDNFQRMKEQEVSMVAHGRPQQHYPGYQHVAAVTPAINTTQNQGYQPQFQKRPLQQYQQPYQQQYQQQPRQQAPPQFAQQNHVQRAPQFDLIPMKYAELLPALLEKNLVQTRAPPRIPEILPSWYRSDRSCAFHQGAPGHDVEQCYALKSEVQKLIRTNILSFKDLNPNVQVNPLPNHGSSANMIQDYQEACP